MSFFDDQEISALAAERRAADEEAARATREAQSRTEEAEALAQRTATFLSPIIQEALGEFPSIMRKLCIEPRSTKAYRNSLFGIKTEYGRQQIVSDLGLWTVMVLDDPSVPIWGAILMDGKGRTYWRHFSSIELVPINEIPSGRAVKMLSDYLQKDYLAYNRSTPEESLWDPVRAKAYVRRAFMEALKNK